MGWSPYRPTGLTHHQPSQTFKGYTLVTPAGGDSVFLLDMDGRIVHRWRVAGMRPGYAQLLAGGTLLVRCVDASLPPPGSFPPDSPAPSFPENVRRLGGYTTHLLELDWSGDAVWEYQNSAMHHDFVRLPNGNTLLPVWVELPEDLARRVRGGAPRRPLEHLPPLLSDDIIEIDPTGAEVWRLSIWRLIDPVRNPICPLETRLEWTHLNGLALTAEGDIVFSCRTNSVVGIVERATGRLSWKWGWPELSHQHHPTVLANGNIQLFDNGMHRVGLPRSRVVEVNPRDSTIVWEYAADPPEQFFSGHVSSAERLPGGNVLICEGAAGRVFEITPHGETVWEWINPFANRAGGRLLTMIFRAHRYGPDYAGLAHQRLDPGAYTELNRLHGLL
jgi:outer membrane protein assembly factor BamB